VTDWGYFADLPLLTDEPLAKYTAARIGGPAERLIVIRSTTADLVDVMRRAWAHDAPVRVIGGGANVLVSDAGVPGLVVVNHVAGFTVHNQTGTLDVANVIVSAGTTLTVLVRRLATLGIDFAWAASVPGTIGGAVVNNAGAHGGDMASDLISAHVVTPGGEAIYPVDYLGYSYRTSRLKARSDRRFLVTEAVLRLRRDSPEAISARIEANIAQRKRTQPPGASLGSIFKNPPGDYAGRLIESCGLKGFAIGGAMISPLHANFFINAGSATAADYAALIAHARAVVAERTGILLETEIEMIGAF
jgi:UDP-N-acetylmuramate dehydrogenase